MKQAAKKRSSVVGITIVLCLTFIPIPLKADPLFSVQKRGRGGTIAEFENAVKDYQRLRENIEAKLPKLSKDSTPQQIEAHKTAFEEAVRAARSGAKQGNLFSAAIASHIRSMLKREFKGRRLRELRETILEAETKGVPLRVNYPYPEGKELTQSPAPLLMKLPKLPKQVKYRFVGRHLLLVDRENGLILDYIVNVLP